MFNGVLLKSATAFLAAATAGLGAPIATITPGDSQVLIKWQAPTDPINGIVIDESHDAGNTWSTVTKLPPTSTQIHVQGLTDGQNYWFRVRWIWPDNSLGIPTPIMNAIPLYYPAAPTGLTATASDSQIALVWDQDTNPLLTGYEIDQSVDGGNTWTVLSNNTGSASNSYLVGGLKTGQTYTFRIKALAFGNVQSDYSDTASATIATAPVTGGFALNYSISNSKVTLTWATPTDIPDVQSYQVNASGDGGLNWFAVANTEGGVNTAVVPYVIGGSTYQVIATSAEGLTSDSQIQLVETNAIPDPISTDSSDSGGTATNPTSAATPTPSSTATTPATAPASSGLPIIPIAGGVAVIGGIIGFINSRRNKKNASKYKSRPKPKPKKKPSKSDPKSSDKKSKKK